MVECSQAEKGMNESILKMNDENEKLRKDKIESLNQAQ